MRLVLLCYQYSLSDLSCTPFGGSPIVRKVEVSDGLREALNDLLHWSCIIRTMRKHYVNIRLLKSLQRTFQPLNNVLLR